MAMGLQQVAGATDCNPRWVETAACRRKAEVQKLVWMWELYIRSEGCVRRAKLEQQGAVQMGPLVIRMALLMFWVGSLRLE